MKILVIRHAVAMDREDYQTSVHHESSRVSTAKAYRGHSKALKNDDLRPLTADGIGKMLRCAEGLSNLVARPAALISSPLTRAVDTAEILKESWEDLEIQLSEALRPESKPADFLKWLRSHVDEDVELIAIVGHEPHLSELVSWFLTKDQKSFLTLKKGGACLLSFDSHLARGKARLEWLATPAILRALR